MNPKNAPQKGNNPKRQKNFTANITLLFLGGVMSISGLVIQFHYHLQKNPNESIVLVLNRMEWNAVHVWTSICFLGAALYHVWAHRKWYKQALKRNFLAKHRPTFIVTLLLFIVSITGLVPFVIACFENNSALRFSMVEIHDKVGILFFIVIFFHTTQRIKWYFNVIKSKF